MASRVNHHNHGGDRCKNANVDDDEFDKRVMNSQLRNQARIDRQEKDRIIRENETCSKFLICTAVAAMVCFIGSVGCMRFDQSFVPMMSLPAILSGFWIIILVMMVCNCQF